MAFGIKTRLKKEWPKLKAAFKFPVDSFNNSIKILPHNDKKIFCVFNDKRLYRDDDGSGRYAYLTMNLFAEMGYRVYFYKKIESPAHYFNLGKYGQYIFSIKNLKVVGKLPARTEDVVLAFDEEELDNQILGKVWKGYVYVNILKPISWKIGNALVPIPYFMHPKLIRSTQLSKIAQRRNNTRKIRVMFAGNTSPDYYNGTEPRLYGQLTRSQGLNVLTGQKITQCFDKFDGFKKYVSNHAYVHRCLVLKTTAHFDVPPHQWLDLISSCDFFICLSGTDLPMCHNVIEAMAVGTIPIIGYPDWFFPALEHRKNAIVYSGENDLARKLDDVMNMNEDEVLRMRKNVVEFYDKNLSAAAFAEKFESPKVKVFTLMLHPRLIMEGSIYAREDKAASIYKLGLSLAERRKS